MGQTFPLTFIFFKMVKTTNQPQSSNYVSQLDLQFWGSPPFCGSPCIAQEIIAKPQNIIHNSSTNHPRNHPKIIHKSFTTQPQIIQKSSKSHSTCLKIAHVSTMACQADTEAANSTAARAETLGWDKHEVRPYTVKALYQL